MKYSTVFSCTFFLIVVFVSSCNNDKPSRKQSEHPQISNSNVDIFEFPIKKFSLPYNIPLKCDSNSLIFLKQVPFDTSYLVQMVSQGKNVRGVCYMVLPSYHRDLEDFYDKEHQLLFFDGFSFLLDT